MRQDVARLMMCGAGGSPSRFFYGQGGKSSFMGKSSNFANIHNYDNNEYFFRGRNHGTDDENSQPNHKNGGRRFTSDNANTYRKSKAPRDARGFAVR